MSRAERQRLFLEDAGEEYRKEMELDKDTQVASIRLEIDMEILERFWLEYGDVKDYPKWVRHYECNSTNENKS